MQEGKKNSFRRISNVRMQVIPRGTLPPWGFVVNAVLGEAVKSFYSPIDRDLLRSRHPSRVASECSYTDCQMFFRWTQVSPSNTASTFRP